jgi:hypothetical protein
MPDVTDNSQTPTPGQVLAGNMPLYARPGEPPSLPAQAPPAQPAQPPPPTPQQIAEHNRHAAIGKAASFLFGAQTDPNTGEPVKQAPGVLFRNLLAGALLGGAIGSEGRANGGSVGSFLSGVSRGGNAVAQQAYQRQQDAQAQEQRRQQMSVEQQRAADEHMVHQATAAKIVAETASFHHQQEFHDQDAIDKKNAAAQQYFQTLTDAGGTAAPIAINGKVPSNGVYSAPELAAAFTKDPSILQAPPNTVRHFIDTHNASDLEYVAGKGWVNQSGDPIDLSKSTTVRVIDVPESIYRIRLHPTGKEINAIAGYQLIPKDQEENIFNAPLDSLSGLYAQNLKNLNSEAQANQRNASAAKANAQANKATTPNRGTPVQFANVEAKKAAALAKAETAFEKDGDDEKLAQAKTAAQSAYEAEVKSLGGSVTPSARVTPPSGKSVVYDPQNTAHFVDSDKLKSFLTDPQYRGWHQ